MILPKVISVKAVYRLYITIVFAIMFVLSIVINTIKVNALSTPRDDDASINYPQIVLKASEFQAGQNTGIKNDALHKKCEGNWFESTKTGKINLELTSLNQWGANSNPVIISESTLNQNKVIIGHNYCLNGNCNSAGTGFSQIINLTANDEVKVCISNTEFDGSVYVSKSFSEYDTYIMSDWLKQPSVTIFTSYGNCKDAACSASDRRWGVGVVEAKR